MSTSAIALAEPDQVTAERYESLIRIATSIRSQKEPRELFEILVHELGQVVPFDGIAQYDEESNKVAFHLCAGCQKTKHDPSQLAKDGTLAAWVYEHQQTVVLGTLDHETRFPASTPFMREAGLQSVCAFPLTTPSRRLGSVVIASMRRDAYSPKRCAFAAWWQARSRSRWAMRSTFAPRNRRRSVCNSCSTSPTASSPSSICAKCSAKSPPTFAAPCSAMASASICRVPKMARLRLYALDFPGKSGRHREGFEPRQRKAMTTRSPSFRTGEPAIMSREELLSDARSPPKSVSNRSSTIPLTGRSQTVGVLSLGSFRENVFAPADLPFLTQVASQVAIAIENALAFGEISDLKDRLAQEKLYLEDEIRSELNFEEIVGKSEALRRVLREVETVAPTDSTVLIYGETGTGKELIARALHNLSSRHARAFVKLNCAAIPTGLLESELFGHENGAFTGAIAQRIGRFELANQRHHLSR